MSEYKPIPTTKAELKEAVSEGFTLLLKIGEELRCNIYPTFKFEKLSQHFGKLSSLVDHLPEENHETEQART